ncbi:hypothetical protein AK812_SmicGene13302 [Symbiodinium microadriaticum]|uniref:Uncharacterized protein n=1 Tax=Symbiodinium microadriaticum TaxID=2951 RepID=A0A1Q9E8I3_SYMMI|nr:hypothetical protein AK812_SmicGene13302 [Symbiodinium microadriaticum]CAE7198713.1 unnamed protein product [Symbiodinium microadriaticum]
MAQKAELVDRIKSLQRTDENAKQAWWSYCEEQHNGVKDPNRHDEYTLSNFLSSYESGGCGKGGGYTPSRPQQRTPTSRFAPAPTYQSRIPAAVPRLTPSARPVMAAPTPLNPMAEVVKVGQRTSPNWRAAWQTFCAAYGNAVNDPTKHPENFLRQFIDFVGETALRELELSGAAVEAPPTKRPRFETPVAEYGDEQKAALVEKIKVMQRSDPTARESWWSYCDLTNKGIRDPNRHQTSSLEQFLSEQGQL